MARLLLACSSAVALLVVSALPSFAGESQPAGGSGTYVIIPSGPPRFADGNVIVDATLKGTVSGTLSGTWTEQAELVIHPDGSQTTHAFGTFTVTTPCGAGAFAFELEGQQPSGASNLTGRWRSIDQNSNTLAIHTVDEFTTPANSGVFTYSGMYGC